MCVCARAYVHAFVCIHMCMIMSWCVEEPEDEEYVSSFLHVGPGFRSQVMGLKTPSPTEPSVSITVSFSFTFLCSCFYFGAYHF